jgi:hypothetical protein
MKKGKTLTATYSNRQYHKTILSLFTALLPTLQTTDPRFLLGARSAAAACLAYRKLNQLNILSYTLGALHSCFIAGLTLVYCLWRAPRELFSARTLEAQRACSLCLTIFGEKWPGAVKYRDVFDALSAGLFRSIVHDGEPQGGSGYHEPLDICFAEVDIPGAHHHLSPGSHNLPDDEMVGDTFDVRGLDTHQVERADGIDLNGFGFDLAPGPRATTTTARAVDGKATASRMVLGAVKEAFMEVDDEAPGGWHGWRMFNEMIQGQPGGHDVNVDGTGGEDMPIDPSLASNNDYLGVVGLDMAPWGDDVSGADLGGNPRLFSHGRNMEGRMTMGVEMGEGDWEM